MHFTDIKLHNWRNFRAVNIPLRERFFITGPNASGKSNLLDAFRFLRDISKTGGGLQQAVRDRGDLSKIRCLAARAHPEVQIEVGLLDSEQEPPVQWRYAIGLSQEPYGKRRVLISQECVWRNGEKILDRPDKKDTQDEWRRTQTHLEQISLNVDFRSLANAFQKILYLHLVPQLLRYPNLANRESQAEDPFGVTFLERIMSTSERTRKARLGKIEKALRLAVPELRNLTLTRDAHGMPHLEAIYSHWRPGAGRQREDQFSDGTLRLIGLLWSLLDGDSLLLLEEPELSLHPGIVSRLPSLIWRLQRSHHRQVILSSHSVEFFSDKGIKTDEVAMLRPRGNEGTIVEIADEKEDIRALLGNGMSIADAVLPMTEPPSIHQLTLFE